MTVPLRNDEVLKVGETISADMTEGDGQSGTAEMHEARLADIARALSDGEVVPPISVRAFLSWFWHSQRRGRWIVSYIRRLLTENKLLTIPDFESAYIDAEFTFALDEGSSSAAESNSVIAEQEVATSSEAIQVKSEPPIFADPTYRISKLAAANKTPTYLTPDATLAEAVTMMMANDYSQLPVMTNERDVKGVISWKSIGARLALGRIVKHVRDAMELHSEVAAEASLFSAIPLIVEHEYALVRGIDKKIVGIITTSDLSLQFQQLSEPFLLLGEVENHIRRIISSRFTVAQLVSAKDTADVNRPVHSAADLSFGEYKRLLEEPARWEILSLGLDRGVFIKLLDRVRETRNDVMHFDPDGIEDSALTVLRDFVKLLRSLQAIGAT